MLRAQDARDTAERERREQNAAEQERIRQEREEIGRTFLADLKVAIEIVNHGIASTGRELAIVPRTLLVTGLIASYEIRLYNASVETGHRVEFDVDLRAQVRVKVSLSGALDVREFSSNAPHLRLVEALTDLIVAAAGSGEQFAEIH